MGWVEGCELGRTQSRGCPPGMEAGGRLEVNLGGQWRGWPIRPAAVYSRSGVAEVKFSELRWGLFLFLKLLHSTGQTLQGTEWCDAWVTAWV